MEIRELKALAAQRERTAGKSIRRLGLIYMGVSVGVSLILAILGAVLDHYIAGTGGLGGMGLRSVLSTAQTVCMLAGTVLMPFWRLGFTQAAMDTARGEMPKNAALLAGFRRFLPGVRLFLLQALVLFALMTAAMNAGSILYMISPLAVVQMGNIEKVLEGAADPYDPAVAAQLLQHMWPLYVLIGIAMILVLIPASYRMRLSTYCLLDGQDRALQNLLEGNRTMRRNCLWMFRLDLSFWWYYLLQGLLAVVANLDLIVGGGQVWYWVFFLVSGLGQMALGWAALPKAETAFALAYEQLRPKQENREA